MHQRSKPHTSRKHTSRRQRSPVLHGAARLILATPLHFFALVTCLATAQAEPKPKKPPTPAPAIELGDTLADQGLPALSAAVADRQRREPGDPEFAYFAAASSATDAATTASRLGAGVPVDCPGVGDKVTRLATTALSSGISNAADVALDILEQHIAEVCVAPASLRAALATLSAASGRRSELLSLLDSNPELPEGVNGAAMYVHTIRPFNEGQPLDANLVLVRATHLLKAYPDDQASIVPIALAALRAASVVAREDPTRLGEFLDVLGALAARGQVRGAVAEEAANIFPIGRLLHVELGASSQATLQRIRANLPQTEEPALAVLRLELDAAGALPLRAAKLGGVARAAHVRSIIDRFGASAGPRAPEQQWTRLIARLCQGGRAAAAEEERGRFYVARFQEIEDTLQQGQNPFHRIVAISAPTRPETGNATRPEAGKATVARNTRGAEK